MKNTIDEKELLENIDITYVAHNMADVCDGQMHQPIRKPWYYDDVPYGEYFWEYAKKTDYYEDILDIKNNFTEEKHQAKLAGAVKLVELTNSIVNSEKNFYKVLNVSKKD